jgi:tetratricopeptide (TPR) repeat protein
MAMRGSKVVLLGLIFAAAAVGAEPSIKEMLAEAKKMSLKPDKTGRVNPNQLVKDSAYIIKMKRRLEVELGKRDHEYRRRNNYRDRGRLWYEIGRYKQALTHALMACRNERDWHTRNGLTHMGLTKLYTMMGQKDLAKKAYEEASGRVRDEHRLRDLNRLKDWMKNFDERKAEAEKLEAKAATDLKDAKSRWQLVELYDYSYPRALDRFVLLLKYKELYPEDKRVTRGECDWELGEALWHFGIRDEALKLAKEFQEKYPKDRRTKGGDAMLRLGGYYHGTGQYAQALQCYVALQEKFTKHWVNRRRDDGSTWIGGRIIDTRRALRGER